MNHPHRDEWVAYAYGEADDVRRQALDSHLAECAPCREQVDLIRKTMASLDTWKLPQKHQPVAGLRTIARVAAAVLLLAVGFGIGQALGPDPVDEEALRDSLAASLEPAIRARIEDDLYSRIKGDVDEAGSETLAISMARQNRILAELVEAFNAARAEDRKVLTGVVSVMESRRLWDQAVLRNDLHTLASAVEDPTRDATHSPDSL